MTRARRFADGAVEFLVPACLIVLVGVVGGFVAPGTEEDFIAALVAVTIVIALHVFVGNSGVLSFGHISFVALGAFAAGLMTIPATVKPTLMPELFPFLAEHDVGNIPSLVLAAALGGLFAALVGIPLMRLSGLAAGIATLATRAHMSARTFARRFVEETGRTPMQCSAARTVCEVVLVAPATAVLTR